MEDETTVRASFNHLVHVVRLLHTNFGIIWSGDFMLEFAWDVFRHCHLADVMLWAVNVTLDVKCQQIYSSQFHLS